MELAILALFAAVWAWYKTVKAAERERDRERDRVRALTQDPEYVRIVEQVERRIIQEEREFIALQRARARELRELELGFEPEPDQSAYTQANAELDRESRLESELEPDGRMSLILLN